MTRALHWGLLVVMVAAFAVRNLPWHLDDYDQAKQAFVSWQIVREGLWWFQQTPDGDAATKPPLMGWLSVFLRAIPGVSWDVAWRLPSFLAAIGVLWALDHGARLIGRDGGMTGREARWLRIAAVSAFGFNLMTPRLATVVRTDTLLTLLLFLIGGLIWLKARAREPWSTRERVLLSVLVVASMFTKGPMVAVFIAPGLIVCAVWCRTQGTRFAGWSGWWPWLAPLLLFAAWIAAGCLTDRQFYEDVVLEEFAGRLTGEHQSQPVYFYAAHLLHNFAPWSWLLAALFFFRSSRRGIASDQSTLWLVCWIAAALAVMSIVPSKRNDRIFPLLPAMALLLPVLMARGRAGRALPLRPVQAALAVGLLLSCGYTATEIHEALAAGDGDLARFGRRVARVAEERGWRIAVRHARDEGLPMYAGVDRFEEIDEIERGWEEGVVRGVVLPARRIKEIRRLNHAGVIDADRPGRRARYFFVAPAESGGGHSGPE